MAALKLNSAGLTFQPNSGDKACLLFSNLDGYRFSLAGSSAAEQNRSIDSSKSLLNAAKPQDPPPLRQDVEKVTSLLFESIPVIEEMKAVTISAANYTPNGAYSFVANLFKDAAKIANSRDAKWESLYRFYNWRRCRWRTGEDAIRGASRYNCD